ncbi:hypothetical protein JZ751_029523, partial [Albula glossodonta]
HNVSKAGVQQGFRFIPSRARTGSEQQRHFRDDKIEAVGQTRPNPPISMSEPRYRDWILETIDSLRSRKARPDLERICRMVRRRHGSDPDRTRSELEKLIQEQTVLKVSYKGSISYRNAAKVQRKSRKKTEQTTGSGGAVGEQTKHAKSNNSDSAHSPTETKETGGKDSELIETKQYCDPKPKTTAVAAKKNEAVLVPASGNCCLSCGAAVCKSQARCAAGSGGVKASAQKDKKLPQTESRSASPSLDASTNDDSESGTTPNKTRGSRGVEAGLSGHEGSNDKEKKTCTSSNASNSHPPGHKQQASLKPKLRVGAKAGSRGGSDLTNPDLGDRLVASVRSLAERSRGAAAARGHTPLGLKEILGFLSSQERLSQEKLTRSKVKVVLEREVARGRLRRTRFGNITLPARGVGAAKPSARLLKSALQDRHMAKKVEVKKAAAMETECIKEEGAGKTQDGSEGAPCSPVGQQDRGNSGCPVPKREMGVPHGVAGGNPQSPAHPCPDPAPMELSHAACAQATPFAGPSISADITDPPSSPQGKLHPISSPSSSSSSSSSVPACPSAACCSEDVQTEFQGDAGTEAGLQSRAVCPSTQRETTQGVEEVRAEESAVTPDQLVSDSQDQLMVVSEGGNLTSSAESCSGYKMEVGEASCLLTPTASPQDSGAMEERGINGGRNDVLTGLSIRLGPALKIYERHVKVLQRTHFQDDSAFC